MSMVMNPVNWFAVVARAAGPPAGGEKYFN